MPCCWAWHVRDRLGANEVRADLVLSWTTSRLNSVKHGKTVMSELDEGSCTIHVRGPLLW